MTRPKPVLYQELTAASSWAASVQVAFSICEHISQQIALWFFQFIQPSSLASSVFKRDPARLGC